VSLRCSIASFFLVVVFTLSPDAYSADPYSAAYSNDSSRLFWILHISDSHIGAEFYDEDSRFFWLFLEALPIIQPELVINTGDLTDGSANNIPTSGQAQEEWERYREVLDVSGVPADYYIDLPGNHDLYGDPGFSYYLQWSLNGSVFGKTTRSHTLEMPFGDYFVYGCSTPDDAGRPFIQSPQFSEAELTELEDELTAHDDAELILVFGHHRPDEPENVTRARNIMLDHGGIYFHGHKHTYDTYVLEGLLTFQVDSLGKATHENVAVISVDNNFVNYGVTDTDEPWPLILVTAPADAYLLSGDSHPYAYEVCNSGEFNPVRALVFDRADLTEVTFQVEGGEPIPMIQDEAVPMLWHGTWDTRGLPEGEVGLTVTATGTRTRIRHLTVKVADVACPEPWDPADGGMVDGDDSDGSGEDGGAEPLDPADDGWDGGADAGGEASGEGDLVNPDGDSMAGDSSQETNSDGCGCGAAGRKEKGHGWLLLVALAIIRRRGQPR
jgi:hypothetical protein